MQRATASSKAIFAWIPSLGAVVSGCSGCPNCRISAGRKPVRCMRSNSAGPVQTGRQAPLRRSSFQRAARSFAEREARKAEMID